MSSLQHQSRPSARRRPRVPAFAGAARLAAAWAIVFIAAAAQFADAQTISPDRIFGRYRQFTWQDQHGLPQNGISSMVKTPDGFLWLAIAEGVARFDGVGFRAFDTGNTPELLSNNVQALCVGRDGTLWIGTHGGGLTSYDTSGRFRHYGAAEGLADQHVRALFEDSRGALWVGTDGAGANVLRDGRFTPLTRPVDGLAGDYVHAFAEDAASGDIWIGTTSGLSRWHDGKVTTFTAADGIAGAGVEALHFDRERRLWIGGSGGLSIRTPDREFASASAAGDREGLAEVEILTIAEDRDGTMWFGTADDGLFRFADGKFDKSTTADGLASDHIQSVLPDESGDLWIGTSGGGLAQLRVGRFEVISRGDDGLPGDMAGAVFADSTGAVWMGTDEGLARVANGRVATVRTSDGHPIRGVSRISEGADGRLWIASSERYASGAILDFDPATGVAEIRSSDLNGRAAAVLHDKAGRVWFGTGDDGVLVTNTASVAGSPALRLRKSDGLADDHVTALFEDRTGRIWIGTRAGLSLFDGREGGGGLTTFGPAEGFVGRYVLSFHEDNRGNIWIGTDGDGLFRYRDGRFGVITNRGGLYDNLAFSILEDDAANLWMSGNKGIYRAPIAELESYLDGRTAAVRSYSYGVTDGMLSRECNGAGPAGTRTRDGRLWFPTIRGVVIVDPNRLGTEPPRVFVDAVIVDDKEVARPGDELVMSPTDENLEIRFTAVSWNRPTQLSFRYRLVGLDNNWVDAGTRRTAYYPHIADGSYRFEVIADNGEGVWSGTGRSFSVRVLPPFYKTWWFVILSALIGVLLVRVLYSYRLRQMRKLAAVRAAFTRQLIDYQENERRRIAGELHDSIGQSLIVIRNRALMSLAEPDKSDRTIAQLEEISASAAGSIQEIREIAHNLHPYQLEHLGLKTALESMIAQAAETTTVEFETRIDDVDDTLSRESEVNFYRIVQESLNNILKHSSATRATVSITRAGDRLKLVVSDNGRGFDASRPEEKGLGLAGIAERARMIDAAFAIESTEGNGTTISVVVRIKHD